MATNNAGLSKPHSKWLLNKSFKISLHRLRRSTASSKTAASGSATASSSPTSSAGRAREYYEVFRRFDADGDGKISSHELRSFLLWAGEKVVFNSNIQFTLFAWLYICVLTCIYVCVYICTCIYIVYTPLYIYI